MRRPAPRELGAALAEFTRAAAPPTLLAGVQEAWERAVGPRVAEQAQPVSERGGTVTVGCRSAVWAQELELLAPDLLERLRTALGTPRAATLAALRFRVERSPRQ
jgi:predicted nucleic acid-binding Zn ribbon protein